MEQQKPKGSMFVFILALGIPVLLFMLGKQNSIWYGALLAYFVVCSTAWGRERGMSWTRIMKVFLSIASTPFLALGVLVLILALLGASLYLLGVLIGV